MKKLKKTIFTLNVDDYSPEITELTYPLIKRYAHKIGADFHIISKRKFPQFPPVYEKLQIYDLGREMKNDWNIYIDSDALVHPDMFDVTEFINKDTVCHNGADMANNRWRYDRYFERDKRHIGSCNWFTIASDWCLDLWHPLDIPYEEALEQIFPIQNELNTIVTRDHLIDDYTLSRNIAKYGLKFTTILKILEQLGDSGNYLWHQYTMTTKEKVEVMRRVMANWLITDYKDPKIDGWTSLNELGWLYLTAQKMNSIVEVGSWKGKSAHALASGCPGKVYLVDNFSGNPREDPECEAELRKNMAKFPNVKIIKANSVEAAKMFEDNSIDMVFIDGSSDRQSVYQDITAWCPKCKKMLCGRGIDLESVRLGIADAQFIPRTEVGNIWSVLKYT
jgi:hypothetical protein